MKSVIRYILQTYRKQVTIAGIIVLLIAIAAPSYYFYNRYRKTLAYMEDPTLRDREQTRQLVEKVGELIDLPQDEEPTIATVSDPEKLKDQPFFEKSKAGDKVLIYSTARKAILYDPELHKIMEVASINAQQPNVAGADSQLEPITFVLLNGTDTSGLTLVYEEELLQQVPNAIIRDRGNTLADDTYADTIIIDVTGERGQQAQALADTLGISVASNIPPDEDAPDADFLIILGEDQE